MGLYTRSGDDGTTGLFGGDRVGKDHPRVEAYGTVDEINADIGMVRAAFDLDRPVHRRLDEILGAVQSRLFDLGADLATPTDSPHRGRIAPIRAEHVAEAEAWIDEIDGDNEPMKTFILPGGTELAARLHTARTTCRRAERRVVVVSRMSDVSTAAMQYLNRLSDLLFAMARRANGDAGVPDVPWVG